MHSLPCCPWRAHPQPPQSVNHSQNPISFRTIAKAVGVATLATFAATSYYRESSGPIVLSNPPVSPSHKLPLKTEILLGGASSAQLVQSSCLDLPVYMSFSPSRDSQSMGMYKIVYELQLKEWSSRVQKVTDTLDSLAQSPVSTSTLHDIYKELDCITFFSRTVDKLDQQDNTKDLTLDVLWGRLADLYLQQNELEPAEKILIFRAKNFVTTQGLLKEALEKMNSAYLNLDSPEKAVHLIDQLKSFSNEYGENFVKDDSIRKTAKYYLIRGNVDEAIQTVARLGFEYERACYMGQYLVPLALKMGDIATARKIAYAIPITPAYGNVFPYELCEDVLLSTEQDLAKELVRQVESSNEKKLSESDFNRMTMIRWF